MGFGGIGQLLGGAAGFLLGGPVGAAIGLGAASGFAQDEANRANQQMTSDQMAFQERMSSTAHQREVSDLKAAGLNPILSVNAGASSPAGAAGTVENAVAPAAATTLQAMQLKKDIDVADSQVKLNEAAEKKALSEKAQTDTNTTLLGLQIPGAAAKAQPQYIKALLRKDMFGDLMGNIANTSDAVTGGKTNIPMTKAIESIKSNAKKIIPPGFGGNFR